MTAQSGFDLIVVGLGAMGAATMLHATRRGLRVLGIDRYEPPHDLGSSHAETRVTRLAVGEGPQYLPFVARSHEIWRELEAETGVRLLHGTGGCIITPLAVAGEERWQDFVAATSTVAAQGAIPFREMDAADLRAEYPAIRIGDHERAGLEPTAGIVMSERAVDVQIRLALVAGATVLTGTTVLDVVPGADSVTVTTTTSRYESEHVVLAAGSWMPEFVGPVDQQALTVTRQVVFWFDVDEPEVFSTDRFPFLIWSGATIDDYLGAFPMPPDGTPGLKVLGEQFAATCAPATVDRTVTKAETDDFYERVVEPRLAGVRRTCIRSSVCLYTNTPDDDFLIDTDPRSDRIMVMSPCSGHGFKHSTALAEAVAERVATGTSTLDLQPFSRDRLTG